MNHETDRDSNSVPRQRHRPGASGEFGLCSAAARSRDLVHWTELADALPVKPVWASKTQDFWAPDVFVARSRSATGPFTIRPRPAYPVVEGDRKWIAPGQNSLIADRGGRTWMLYHGVDSAMPRSNVQKS